jgi:hypothetical protein
MRVAVTGASGLLGSAVCRDLRAGGHETLSLVRRAPRSGEVRWDPAGGPLDAAALETVDAVVHLAGENIAGGRWTAARKQRIRASRVGGTHHLATALARLARPPRALVCASAAGYYGDRGDKLLAEDAPAGRGFLAEVCQGWEAAADPARARGIRVVNLRIGLVLDRRGGALQRIMPIFRWGLGAPLGSGRQWWSWITLEDVVAIVLRAVEEEWDGAWNAVAPHPVTNREFTRALARAVGRWTLPAVPRLALGMLFGEMAMALLLSSARLVPAKLVDAGFPFRYPNLEPALRALVAGR